MISSVDQRIVWVSEGFAEHVGLLADEVTGRPLTDLLGVQDDRTWAELFAGSRDIERSERFSVQFAGHGLSADRYEVRRVRSVDGGRNVMLTLRLVAVSAEWESDEAFTTELRAGMRGKEIFVAYQPIVDIASGELKKVEALARWTHPARGTIGPDVFIPWAERTGLINELGEWILARSCEDIAQMEGDGIVVDLTVNVSVVQLQQADVLARFAEVLRRTPLAPERVWVEVTESVLLDGDALSRLVEFQSLGIRLAIDDFGTGHANFEYLTRLVVDALKIDTTFVAGLGTESGATAIVRSVIGLGRELGLEIVAEGIENESQRCLLLDLHCRLGQGWLFSPALPRADLVAMYAPAANEATAGATASPHLLIERPAAVDESVRLMALRACRILDTNPEAAFESLVLLASQLLAVPIALISFMDADRQWFKARLGTDLTQVSRPQWPVPMEAAHQPEPLTIIDASRDDRVALDPLFLAIPNARSSAGVPIVSREGLPMGTFSVIDFEPRTFTPRELGQLTLLALQVSELLDLRRRTVELDALYIGARHDQPGRRADIPDPAGIAAPTRNSALAQLARVAGRHAAAQRDDDNFLRFGGLTLDLDDRTMSVNGQPALLAAREFDLLAFLAARPGQVFTREELLEHVWKSKSGWQDIATVTEHIHRLRAKIESDPNHPRLLRTVRGKGYSFEPTGVPLAVGGVTDDRSGTWVHRGSRVVAADEGMAALLGLRTPADLIGRDVNDFLAPVSQPALQAAREMRAAGFDPDPQIITLHAADGTERLTLLSTDAGEFDGAPAIIGIAREVLDVARLMRQMVSGVVSEVSDAVIVTDPDLRVMSWNPAAARLYGWSEPEVLGHSMQAVVRGDEAFHKGAPWQQLQRHGSWTGVVDQKARDGSTVTVASSATFLRDQGDVIGIVIVNRPVPPELAQADGPNHAELTSADPPFLHITAKSRHDALEWWRSLDMSPDPAFDPLTRLAARLMGSPNAALSLIGPDRQFFLSKVGIGIDVAGMPRGLSFSTVAIATPNEALVVNDTTLDERFADNSLVTSAPFIRSYAGMPICTREGLPIGTLNVVDTEPREFTDQQINILTTLALQAAALLDLRRRAGELDDLVGDQAVQRAVEERLR